MPSSLHQSIKYIAKNHLVTVHAEEDLTLLRSPAIPFIDVENNIPPDAHHAFELVPATFVPKHAFPSKPQLSSSNLMVAKIMLENGFEPGKGIGQGLQGRINPIELRKADGTFGLGYKPTKEDRRRAVEERRRKNLEK